MVTGGATLGIEEALELVGRERLAPPPLVVFTSERGVASLRMLLLLLFFACSSRSD